MRRTDRLFEIIQLFRGGRLWVARDIAERLEVSVRTIYRDIDTLAGSGVPIEGERGVGYILREPIFLPPLTLTANELEALQLGMEIVQQAAGEDLADAAGQLLTKIDAVLPSDRRGRDHLDHLSVYAPNLKADLVHLADIRRAIAARRVIQIRYTKLDGAASRRHIRPLQAEFWGRVWTCTAWCELRRDFRVFRIDRISRCTGTGQIFENEPGKTYKDYLARLGNSEE